MPDELLTIKEAAVRRGVRPGTVNTWIHHAENPLAALRRGYQWMIDPADLAAYQPWPPGKPCGRRA